MSLFKFLQQQKAEEAERQEAERQKSEYEKLQVEAKSKAEAEEKNKKLNEEAKASAEQKRLEAQRKTESKGDVTTTGTLTDKVEDDKKAKNKKLLMWSGVAVAGLIFLVILVKKVGGGKAVATSSPTSA